MNERTYFQNFGKTHPSVLLCGAGVLGGFVNGLLGAGGGIVIVFLISSLTHGALDGKDVFANALAVMLPVSIVSLISYSLSGNVGTADTVIFAFPALLGGLLGAFLLERIRTSFLKKLFTAIVLWSGFYMIVK